MFFTVALAVPSSAWIVWIVMAAAVVLTVVERTRWISRQLASEDADQRGDVAKAQARLERVA